jgi:hypothetical protein
MAKNGWKQVFDNTYLHNLLFYTQICSMGQQVVFSYPILHLWHQISTLWATVATHLRVEMAKSCWKHIFDDTSETSYSTHKYVLWANKWCSFVPWYYPRCLLHSQPHIVTLSATIANSFVSKNGQKWLKTGFWRYLLPKPRILHKNMFNYPMVSPKARTLLMT